MSLKPKTIRRLTLLVGVAVLLVVSAFTLLVVRRWQNERIMAGLRAEGLAAVEAGDHYLALNKFAPYLRAHFDDAEAIKAYALARSRVEEFDGSHLMQAIGHYRRYLEMRPEDREAAVTLLGWFNQVSHYPEARDLAAGLRPADPAEAGPEHAEVLRQEAIALLALRVEGERLRAVSQRLVEVAPEDIQAQMLRMQAIVRAEGVPAAQAYAQNLLEDRPGDPRAQLAHALSMLLAPRVEDLPHVRSLLSDVAGLRASDAARLRPTPSHDPQFVRLLVEAFDRLHQFDHSREVLVDAAEASGDLVLRQLLVRRLWQDGRHADVERLTASLDPADPTADAERLGFRALSLASLGRRDEAAAIVAGLAAREGDFRAAGWALALPTRVSEEAVAPRESLDALRQAIEQHPLEPVFSYFRGEALAALERAPEALKSWASAARSPVAAGWVLPHARSAEVLIAEGRVEEAVEAATEAIVAAPANIAVNVLWFEAQAARLERGLKGDLATSSIITRLERTRERLAIETDEVFRPYRERLAAAHAAMLAASGDRDGAAEVIRELMEGSEPLEVSTLQRLAATSQTYRLGLTEACLERAEELHGLTPGLALARANAMAAQGRVAEGRKRLEAAAGAAAPEAARGFEIALATFLQSVGDPGATAAWVALGDKHPDDVQIQRLCIDAPAAAGDPAFIARASQRYRTLAGRELEPDSVPVRLARARALLRGQPTKQQRAEAVALLNSAVVEEPSLLEPRLLLAAALRMDDPSRDLTPDLPGAISQLTTAARLAPNSAAIGLDLGRSLQAAREFDRARQELQRIANDRAFGPADRFAACQLLLAQADAAAAVPPLNDLVTLAGEDASPGLLVTLATAHRSLRQDELAEAALERLLDSPRATSESLLAAAIFFAAGEADDRARAAVERAAELAPNPGAAVLVRARFAAETGDPAAGELFEQACRESPGEPAVWSAYTDFLLSRGEREAALEVAGRARAAAPSDPRIAVLHERAKLAANAEGDAELGPLLSAMSADSAYAQLKPVLNAIDQLRQAGRLDDPRAIADLADRLQSFLPVQIFAARRLAEIDPPDLERAAAIASRAILAFPARHEPAQLAAELYARLGRWQDMLRAAEVWRDRDPERSAASDLAVAQARFALGNVADALRAVAQRVGPAAAAPREPLSVAILEIYARALVATGRAEQAKELLAPLLPGAPELRAQVWIAVAARDLRTAELAGAWLEQVAPMIDPGSPDEQLALAAALSALATRFPDRADEFLGRATEVLTALVQGVGAASPAAVEALGITRHRTGDLAGAEEAYRRAIELDSRRAVALNNMATLLMERGDLEGAVELASRAVDAGGASVAASLDTLVRAHRGLGDRLREAGGEEAATAQYAAAAAACERLAALRPEDHGTLMLWADCAAGAGDLAAEVRAYERRLAAPGLSRELEVRVRNNLAYALFKIGGRAELERARDQIARGLALADHAELHDTLGWIEARAGRRDAAAEAFRRALERRPGMPSASVGLAAVLAEGTPEARREAADLLAALQGLEEPISPDLAAQASDLRKKLGGS